MATKVLPDDGAAPPDKESGSDFLQSTGLRLRKPPVLAKLENTVKGMSKKFKLAPGHKLLTDPNTRKISMRVVSFACFVDVCCGTILAPNYNFMCTPGAHVDSFSNTDPFEIGMAINMIPASGAIGKIFASAVIVKLSNKIGRKKSMLMCLFMGAVGCVLKFLCRKNYWAFLGANFFNGLFSASIIVGMAYAEDVYGDNPAQKTEEINGLMGLLILGGSFGNLVAIGMENVGLFEGLIVGAGISVLSGLLLMIYMVEPDHEHKQEAGKATKFKESDTDHVKEANPFIPMTTDKPTLYKIVVGSCLDSLGSAGPPLMFQLVFYVRYYADYIESCYTTLGPEYCPAQATPIIAASEYKWFDTLVMVTFFGTMAIMMPVMKAAGPAGTCVLGNFLTAAFTGLLYFLAKEIDPSRGMMIIFITCFYTCNVLTTLSLVTTQPMIDAVVAKEDKADAMALNQMAQDLMGAVTPLLFSYLLDSQGEYFFMWFALICSLIATGINVPLMRDSRLSAKTFRDMMDAEKPKNKDALKGDLTPDGDGWISSKELNAVNEKNFEEAMAKGEPFMPIKLKWGKYDPTKLGVTKTRAVQDFIDEKDSTSHWIELAKDPQEVKNIIAAFAMIRGGEEGAEWMAEQRKGAGDWITDYLHDTGYDIYTNPTMMKMMIMTVFPPLLKPGADGMPTEENMRKYMIKYLKLQQELLHTAKDRRNPGFFAAFGKTGVTLGA